MKTAHWISLFLTAGMFTFTACGKRQPPPPPPSVDVNGVKLDLPKFQQAFAGSIQFSESLAKVSNGIRYHQYDAVLKELKLLAANPGLNDQQKTAVADFNDQVKQLMDKPDAP